MAGQHEQASGALEPLTGAPVGALGLAQLDRLVASWSLRSAHSASISVS